MQTIMKVLLARNILHYRLHKEIDEEERSSALTIFHSSCMFLNFTQEFDFVGTNYMHDPNKI